MSGSDNTMFDDETMSDEFDDGTEPTVGGEIHYVSEGSNLLMGGNASQVANAIDAETERVNALVRLEEVRLETKRFDAEREDVSFERLTAAVDELRQSMRNPFADLLTGSLGDLLSDARFDAPCGRTSAD